MLNFRAAYLPDKFWGRRSVVVPRNRVVVDERFHTLEELLLDEVQRSNFEIFWIEKDVSGNVMLPGELNYAYINGKFYHMEKVTNQGFMSNGEHEENFWGYYLEYDDWQNDWLRNNVQIKGTISKTGDWKLAADNIIQLSPLITGTSGFKFYGSGEKIGGMITLEEEDWKEPKGIMALYDPNDLDEFNKKLSSAVRNPPDPLRLRIPLTLKKKILHLPEERIYQKVRDFFRTPNLRVYDIRKDVLNLTVFKVKNRLNNVYVISSKGYHSFEVGQSENAQARVRERVHVPAIGKEGIQWLTTDLTPVDRNGIKFSELVDKWLRKYPTITSTRDKAELKLIAYKEILTTFRSTFLDGGSSFRDFDGGVNVNYALNERYKYNPILPDNKDGGNLGITVTPTERLMSKNGIYPPGTPFKYIRVLYSAGENYSQNAQIKNPSHIWDINQSKYKPKNSTSWFASRDIEELTAWLDYLTKTKLLLYPTFTREANPGEKKLKGSLTLDFSTISPNIMLIPDYRTNGWVLAGNLPAGKGALDPFYTTRILRASSNLIDTFLPNWLKGDAILHINFQEPNKILEIGEVDAKANSYTWQHPNTDEILNNTNPIWSKYATIIPMIVRWAMGYKFARDSYDYKLAYEFTDKRWRGVKAEGSSSYESKRFNIMFQFPLSGCGFDIVEILKDYTHLNERYLRWNFICSEELKDKHEWRDRGGKFDGYYDLRVDGSNAPKPWPQSEREDHMAFNESIEIRIYSRAGASKSDLHALIFKLWVYYFGWRWDGSYNGAVLLNSYGSDQNSGFLELSWAKPFAHRWYRCSIWVNNYHGDGLGGAKQSSGKLLYGKGSPTWDPEMEVWAIGYQYARNTKGRNTNIGPVLTGNCKEMELRINTDGDFEKVNTFGTGHIQPIKFAHLFLGSSICENVKFTLNKPDENTFGEYSVGKFLKDLVKDKTFTTNRTLNPTNFNPFRFRPLEDWSDLVTSVNLADEEGRYGLAAIREFESLSGLKGLSDLDFSIPFYIARVIDPDSITSKFKHKSNFTGSVADALKDFKRTLQLEIHNALVAIQTQPFIFTWDRLEWVCVAKINAVGEWEFELISKNNRSIETVEAKSFTFTNPTKEEEGFETFIRRINSQFEVVVYGQRIPIKTRPDTTKENIDIGLKITPINDPKQTITSLWYMVEIRAEQDTQRMRIEVPKELNTMNIERPYERESILRTMAYHSKDREIERMQYLDEVTKYSYDLGVKGQRLDINRNREITSEVIGMAQTSLQMAQGMGLGNVFTGGAAMAAVGGAAALAGQAANMVYSKQLYNLNLQEHHTHGAMGQRALELKGDLMRSRHEQAQETDRLKLYNMQTNMNHPANSDSLIYREENKQFNLTDVHLVQYYPDGQLLKFLMQYYEEYGFNVIVPNQRCFGVDWIKGHIQFIKITSNVHHNETIRRMIEERAMAGITLVENDDWHADRVEDLREEFQSRE